MLFGQKNKKNRNFIPNIKINDETLDIVNETKFSGIILDSELNWKSHVNYTSKKLAKDIAIISKTKQFFNKKNPASNVLLLHVSLLNLWKSNLG